MVFKSAWETAFERKTGIFISLQELIVSLLLVAYIRNFRSPCCIMQIGGSSPIGRF